MTAPLRILHVTNSLGAGGAEMNLVSILARTPPGFENHVAYFDPQEQLLGDFRRYAKIHWVGGRAALWNIRRLIDGLKVDVVHTQLLDATFLGRLAALGTACPVLTTLQNAFYDGKDFGRFSSVRKPLTLLLDRLTSRRAWRLIAVSNYVKAHFVEQTRFPAERIDVIPNCLDRSRVHRPAPEAIARARRDVGLGDEDVVLIDVARLMKEKGQADAIRALPAIKRKVPRARLLLVGQGPERASFEALARTLEVGPDVIFAGVRPDVPALLHGSDLFVFPSRREGLSVALVEALAVGLPAVVGDIPQNREVGEGLSSVRFIPAGVPEKLAEEAIALLTDPQARANAERAAQGIEERHSPERAAELFFAVCNQAAGRA